MAVEESAPRTQGRASLEHVMNSVRIGEPPLEEVGGSLYRSTEIRGSRVGTLAVYFIRSTSTVEPPSGVKQTAVFLTRLHA
jgi:hypothetical protein